MKKIGIFLIVSVILWLLSYLGVKWDMWLHPWVYTAASEWRWWNYFTSEHSPSVLFILHPWVWAGVVAFFSLIATALVTKED